MDPKETVASVVGAVEAWQSEVREESRAQAEAGLVLVGVGAVVGAAVLLKWRRSLLAWALPGALLAAGAVLLADALLDTRSERIDEAGRAIEDELAQLDPLARAQVLKRVGESQLKAFVPGQA